MLTRALHLLPPEAAHRLAIRGLARGLAPRRPADAWPSLAATLCGLALPNPLGLAAGFDKNAEALAGLSRMGFGFVEIGTVTPQPQDGNPKPRLFRLPQDRALINRMGFNGEGLERVQARLARRRPEWGVIGANIGANRDAVDPIEDYVTCLRGLYPLVDYVAVNVSSPNTPGLRRLQHGQRLETLLAALTEARRELIPDQRTPDPSTTSLSPPGPTGGSSLDAPDKPGHDKKEAPNHRSQNRGIGISQGRARPILLKIAPDLDEGEERAIAEAALAAGIDGLIVGNTTLARPDGLRSRHRHEAGGLSGAPLLAPSTAQLRRIWRLTGGRLPLIGVGGIFCGADAYAKLTAGASAVQLYTALIYQGPGVVPRILAELAALLARAGHADVAAAVGRDA